jgi:hypothetical protein
VPNNFATDEAYGSEAILDDTGPIRLDELEGAVPAEEMKGHTECLTCGLCAWACVCKREGA